MKHRSTMIFILTALLAVLVAQPVYAQQCTGASPIRLDMNTLNPGSLNGIAGQSSCVDVIIPAEANFVTAFVEVDGRADIYFRSNQSGSLEYKMTVEDSFDVMDEELPNISGTQYDTTFAVLANSNTVTTLNLFWTYVAGTGDIADSSCVSGQEVCLESTPNKITKTISLPRQGDAWTERVEMCNGPVEVIVSDVTDEDQVTITVQAVTDSTNRRDHRGNWNGSTREFSRRFNISTAQIARYGRFWNIIVENQKQGDWSGTIDVTTPDCANATAGRTGGSIGSIDSPQITPANAEQVRQLRVIDVGDGPVISADIRFDNQHVIAGTENGAVLVWDVNSGRQVMHPGDHPGGVEVIRYSPRQGYFVSGGGDHLLKLWDQSTGERLQLYEGHNDYVESVAFDNGSTRIASGAINQNVIIWDIQTGNIIHTLQGHHHVVEALDFSWDYVVSGALDGEVIVWDADSGRELYRTGLPNQAEAESISINSNETAFAVAYSDNTVRIYNISNGREVRVLSGHTASVESVNFSRLSGLIVSSGQDNVIIIWDVQSGAQLARLIGHTARIDNVRFSRDEHLIVSGSSDGTVRVWGIP
jgi:WD40 repeat protein